MNLNQLDEITAIVRDCDKKFIATGGSTRHYVRDLFLPLLEENGLYILKIGAPRKLITDTSGIKKEIARKLRSQGYSIRQIQRALGYKSPRSIHKIINEPLPSPPKD